MDGRIFLILALACYFMAFILYHVVMAVAGLISYCWQVVRRTDWRSVQERMQANAAISRFNRGKARGYPALAPHLIRPGMRFNKKANRIEIVARRHHSFLRDIRW